MGPYLHFASPLPLASAAILATVLAGCLNTSPLMPNTDTLPDRVATPAISLPGGSYGTNQFLTLSCATPGAKIYFSTNGVEPNVFNGFLYSSIYEVKCTMNFKAVATKEGFLNSIISGAAYSLPPVSLEPYVLHNKLGSLSEFGASLYGPVVSVGNLSLSYIPVQFGNGALCLTTDEFMTFPKSAIDITRGALEFWFLVQYESNTIGTSAIAYFDTSATSGAGDRMFIKMTGGASALLNIFNNSDITLNNVLTVFPTNTIHHFAMCWDRNFINAANETLQIYFDGALKYSQTNGSYKASPSFSYVRIGGTPTSPAKMAFDNLKVYNYAKTNFSDRFSEL